MTHPTPEEPLAALREEIRQAGRGLERGAKVVAAIVVITAFLSVQTLMSGSGLTATGLLLAMLVSGGVAVVLASLMVLVTGRRLFGQVRLLRHRLSDLNSGERQQLLRSIADGPSGGSQMIASLILEARSGSPELTPAETPDGSGAEVSGVARRGELE